MDVRNVSWTGKFDSIVDPKRPHRRVTVNAIWVKWQWRPDGSMPWRDEILFIPANTSWDGTSRPSIVGWLVPRWGVFSLASLIHDFCFVTGPFLTDGSRITRKHTDMLFLEVMRELAKARVDQGWKAPAQLALADVMYTAVRWFGPATWNKHEFRQGS